MFFRLFFSNGTSAKGVQFYAPFCTIFPILRQCDGGGGYKQVEQLTKVSTSKLLLAIFDDVDCPFTYDWTKTIAVIAIW